MTGCQRSHCRPNRCENQAHGRSFLSEPAARRFGIRSWTAGNRSAEYTEEANGWPRRVRVRFTVRVRVYGSDEPGGCFT